MFSGLRIRCCCEQWCRSLTWEPPYATSTALEKPKKKKKKKKKKKNQKQKKNTQKKQIKKNLVSFLTPLYSACFAIFNWADYFHSSFLAHLLQELCFLILNLSHCFAFYLFTSLSKDVQLEKPVASPAYVSQKCYHLLHESSNVYEIYFRKLTPL